MADQPVRASPVSAHPRPQTRTDRRAALPAPDQQRRPVLKVIWGGTPGLLCSRAILEVRDVDLEFPSPRALRRLRSVNPQILGKSSTRGLPLSRVECG